MAYSRVAVSMVWLIVLIGSSCHEKSETAFIPQSAARDTTPLLSPVTPDSVTAYFSKQKPIKLAALINFEQAGRSKFKCGGHAIDYQISNGHLQVDDDLVNLNAIRILNESRIIGSGHQILQVKHYPLNKTELLGFVLGPGPCNGHYCNTYVYLVYDCRSQTISSWVGNGGSEFNLYRLYDSESVDFLFTDFQEGEEGKPVAEPVWVSYYAMYSLVNGVFTLKKSEQKQPFFLRQIKPMAETSSLPTRTEGHWFAPLH